jgi:peptidoglycan-associated lipoprotein
MNELHNKTRVTWIAASALAIVAAACSHETQAREPATPYAAAQIDAAHATEVHASTNSVRNDRDTTVALSDEIRTGCSMPAGDESPQFDYDEAQLRPRGADILNDVAQCLTRGSLRDRSITIIGRTDPRGTESHNEELGANRASAARDYLTSRGVSADRIQIVSRGEEGAHGGDEATWALDRRVDIQLGQGKGAATNGGSARAGTPLAKGATLSDVTREMTNAHKNTKAATYSDAVETGSGGPPRSEAVEPPPAKGAPSK